MKKLSEEQGRVLIELARKAIMEGLHLPIPPEKREVERAVLRDPVFQEKLGVFVTLHLGGHLRGCIGSLVGTRPLAEGVRQNAVNAAFNDHRFRQVTPPELAKIDIEISVLSEPQPLLHDGAEDLPARLRPGIDGVAISKEGLSATFLPQVWEQLPETGDFLSHLCRKAGLPGDQWRRGDLQVSTYQVQSFAEQDH